MDLTFCSVCVWILTVFLTVHADLNVNCPNIRTHTKEDPLILKCSVTCNEGCILRGHQWRTNIGDKTLYKNTTSDHIGNYTEFNYTIQNQSDKQSGTYHFWIQTDRGAIATPFTVTIGFGVNCPNITNHTEGAPLTIKCNVTCEDGCTLRGYSWINVGENTTLYESNTSYRIENYEEFNYTFQNQSDKQSGTYNFWIQTEIGTLTTNFTVGRKPEKRQGNLIAGGIASLVICSALLIIIVVVVYKGSVTLKSVDRRRFGWSAPPETYHSDHVEYKHTVKVECESKVTDLTNQ